MTTARSAVKIYCPNCGRILGDVEKSGKIDIRLNCRGCKKTVDIKMRVVSFADYLKQKKEEENGEPR